MMLNQYSFQDGFSKVAQNYAVYHDSVVVMTMVVGLGVLIFFYWVCVNYGVSLFMVENKSLEFIWTLAPILMLLSLAMPSMKMLYIMDGVTTSSDSGSYYKVMGNQWYWSYKYNIGTNLEYDSYMLADSDLEMGDYRLLEVDNPLVCKMGGMSNFLITASDVIHSFAVPAMGMKMDAVPGRLNQQSVMLNSLGSFYGQCSELCGAKHSFMPMNVEVVKYMKYFFWCKSN